MRIKRIDLIEQYVFEHRSVSIDALCEEFQVSKNTIRRDLDFLVKKGSIQKVYGGVVANENPNVNELVSFEDRHITNMDAKDSIARLAASYVEDNDTIYMDTGTTTLNMIDYLTRKKCTIITNSIQIVFKALPYPNLNIICLPGTLKRSTSSFVGAGSIEFLSTFNINKAFMACTGLTLANGLTNATTEEYQIKKAAIDISQKHFILADHTKFGRTSLMTYCRAEQLHYVVTDRTPEPDYVNYFKEHGIELLITQ